MKIAEQITVLDISMIGDDRNVVKNVKSLSSEFCSLVLIKVLPDNCMHFFDCPGTLAIE